MFGNLAALCSCASHYNPFISSCSLALWEIQSNCDVARYPAYCICRAYANYLSFSTDPWNNSEPRLHFFLINMNLLWDFAYDCSVKKERGLAPSYY